MKKNRTLEKIEKMEREIVNNLFDKFDDESEIDELINFYESKITDKERLKKIKYQYLLSLSFENDFMAKSMMNNFPPQLLELLIPKAQLLIRIHEVMLDDE